MTKYAPGKPCWADVTSPDVDAAASFYGELFGWQADKAPQPEAGGYTMFSKDGKAVAAASPPPPGQEGVPPHWTVYLASDDVDATAGQGPRGGRAGVHGAARRVRLRPDDRRRGSHGRRLRGVAGGPAHRRAAPRRAGDDELGRGADEGPGRGAGVLRAGLRLRDRGSADGRARPVRPAEGGRRARRGPDQDRRGLGRRSRATGRSCSRSTTRTRRSPRSQELGGQRLMEPMDIPEVGRFAVVADPWGAPFQVIK